MNKEEIRIGKLSIPTMLFAGIAGCLTLFLGYLNYYNARYPIDKSADLPRFIVVPSPYIAPDGILRIQVESPGSAKKEDLTVRVNGLEHQGLGKYQSNLQTFEWHVPISALRNIEPEQAHTFEFRFPGEEYGKDKQRVWVTKKMEVEATLITKVVNDLISQSIHGQVETTGPDNQAVVTFTLFWDGEAITSSTLAEPFLRYNQKLCARG